MGVAFHAANDQNLFVARKILPISRENLETRNAVPRKTNNGHSVLVFFSLDDHPAVIVLSN